MAKDNIYNNNVLKNPPLGLAFPFWPSFGSPLVRIPQEWLNSGLMQFFDLNLLHVFIYLFIY